MKQIVQCFWYVDDKLETLEIKWFLEVKAYNYCSNPFQTLILLLINCQVCCTVMTTHKKLLNICLVSSDERELENIMNEQYTAAQAAHLS